MIKVEHVQYICNKDIFKKMIQNEIITKFISGKTYLSFLTSDLKWY